MVTLGINYHGIQVVSTLTSVASRGSFSEKTPVANRSSAVLRSTRIEPPLQKPEVARFLAFLVDHLVVQCGAQNILPEFSKREFHKQNLFEAKSWQRLHHNLVENMPPKVITQARVVGAEAQESSRQCQLVPCWWTKKGVDH